MKIILIEIGLLFWIIGCQPTVSELYSTTAVIKKATNEPTEASPITASLPTSHPTSQTVTPVAISIASPTGSLIPQPTFTPSSKETTTPTPWPTLPPEEAANKVLSLLEDNQNPDCLLPCWWGAIPGQTQWQDIEPLLSSFAIKIDKISSGALVKLPLPESIAVPGFDYYISFGWDELGVIQKIYLKSMNITGYDAKTMLMLYGIPDEVWIKTIPAPREGVLPFQLIIVYQQKGFSFHYYVNATKTDDTITACFEPGFVESERPDLFPAGPRIYIWVPSERKEIEEISSIPLEVYYPLEDKTDLTPETLYKRFTNPNEEPCISTPADLWRN